MSDPITTVYKPHYRKILRVFTLALPRAYCGYTNATNTQYDEQDLDRLQRDFEQCIAQYSENIFIATSAKINTYLNDFSVAPKGSIDEFKIIFFLAQTLSDFLKRDELNSVSKIVLSTMIGLLDFRLEQVKAKRPVLTEQTLNMIRTNTLAEKTGKIGLYLTYKCLYNHASAPQLAA